MKARLILALIKNIHKLNLEKKIFNYEADFRGLLGKFFKNKKWFYFLGPVAAASFCGTQWSKRYSEKRVTLFGRCENQVAPKKKPLQKMKWLLFRMKNF